jgi:enoyl-CoA hydratase/carnithine racemase
MGHIRKTLTDNVAQLVLSRGKVNAINEELVDELKLILDELESDDNVGAIVLTGQGSFFSFGLDVPEFLTYSKESFQRFVTKFAGLYTQVFLYPKAVVAALNGHATAGGCMLALACDMRIMSSGKAGIGLNEVTFGSSLFPGSAEMLKHCVGPRNAEIIGLSGAMYSAEEAMGLGLVDHVVEGADVNDTAISVAKKLARNGGPAFASIKSLLRLEVSDEMKRKDEIYAPELVDIWYSESTQQKLGHIKIR